MNKFIEVTTEYGKRSISIAHIALFRQRIHDNRTAIYTSFGEILVVSEPYEEVKWLIIN